MKEYLFRVMFSDSVDTEYVRIEAENISEARKEFQNRMKSVGTVEWYLINVYRSLH